MSVSGIAGMGVQCRLGRSFGCRLCRCMGRTRVRSIYGWSFVCAAKFATRNCRLQGVETQVDFGLISNSVIGYQPRPRCCIDEVQARSGRLVTAVLADCVTASPGV